MREQESRLGEPPAGNADDGRVQADTDVVDLVLVRIVLEARTARQRGHVDALARRQIVGEPRLAIGNQPWDDYESRRASVKKAAAALGLVLT